MDITPLIKPGLQVIQSYAGGRFRVSGQVYEGALIVLPEKSVFWAASGGVKDQQIGDFEVLVRKAAEIDVVLLGCGKVMTFLDPKLKQELRARKLNVEIMDTGAACRTYNVLMAEGRRVAAALLPIDVF